MKALRLPAFIWMIVVAASLISIPLVSAHLPARVAVHFGVGGAANRWTGRGVHDVTMAAVMVLMAVFLPALCYSFRFFSPRGLNVPHPGYWRSPAHYPEACDYLFVQSLWLGAAMGVWATGLNILVARANRSAPPHLSGAGIWLLALALLAVVGVWIAHVMRFFRRVDPHGPNED